MVPPNWIGLFSLFFAVFHLIQGAPTNPFDLLAGRGLLVPPSPLDRQPKPKAIGNLVSDLSTLSTCQKGCSSGLMDSLGIVMKSMSHIQRYEQICKNYNESYSCIEKEKKCGKEDFSMFETFTSGVRYMCIDQHLAFQNTIKCIDDQSNVVQTDCENKCQTKSKIMQLVMRSPISQQILKQFTILSAPAAAEAPAIAGIDPNMLNELNHMSAELCGLGDCVLDCIKNKFDTQCEGSAGALLTEVFVRPIAATHDKLAAISPFLGLFVPQQCNYMYNASALKKYRIDSSKEADIRRMYKEKEAEKLTTVEPVQPAQPPVLPIAGILSPLDSTSINALPKVPSNPLTQSGKITPSPSDGKKPSGAVKPTIAPVPGKTTGSGPVKSTAAPIKPAEPVGPTSRPVKPTSAPVKWTPEPATPSPIPVGLTSGPVKPTPASVEPTNPVKPTPVPVAPVSGGVRPTPAVGNPGKPTSSPRKPEKPTPAPGRPTPGPASPSSAPAKPTPAPVRPTPGISTSGPVKPTPSPVKASPGPDSPTPAPIRPSTASSAPVRPTTAPSKSTSPVKPTPGSVSPSPAPVRPTAAPSMATIPSGKPSPAGKLAPATAIHRCRH